MIRDEKMIIPKEKMVHGTKKQNIWAVVVAQLVGEDRGTGMNFGV